MNCLLNAKNNQSKMYFSCSKTFETLPNNKRYYSKTISLIYLFQLKIEKKDKLLL